MKYAIILLLTLVCSYSFGQSIEFCFGTNYNKFYDLHNFRKDYGHFSSAYTPDLGYSFSLGISDLKIDSVKRIKIIFSVNNYNGGFKISDGGLGYGYEIEARAKKTNIALGFFPFNFSVDKTLHVSLGGEFGYLINEKLTGHSSSWDLTNTSPSVEIIKSSEGKSYKANFGLCGSIYYQIKIRNNWYFSPQYKYYLGLSKEFDNTDPRTKSIRHIFMIGLINTHR